MGYDFVRVTPSLGMKARNEGPITYLGDTLDIYNVFWIRVSFPKTIDSHCNIYDRSCADLSKNMILLNRDRWVNGSENAGLSLQTYRQALSRH